MTLRACPNDPNHFYADHLPGCDQCALIAAGAGSSGVPGSGVSGSGGPQQSAIPQMPPSWTSSASGGTRSGGTRSGGVPSSAPPLPPVASRPHRGASALWWVASALSLGAGLYVWSLRRASPASPVGPPPIIRPQEARVASSPPVSAIPRAPATAVRAVPTLTRVDVAAVEAARQASDDAVQSAIAHYSVYGGLQGEGPAARAEKEATQVAARRALEQVRRTTRLAAERGVSLDLDDRTSLANDRAIAHAFLREDFSDDLARMRRDVGRMSDARRRDIVVGSVALLTAVRKGTKLIWYR